METATIKIYRCENFKGLRLDGREPLYAPTAPLRLDFMQTVEAERTAESHLLIPGFQLGPEFTPTRGERPHAIMLAFEVCPEGGEVYVLTMHVYADAEGAPLLARYKLEGETDAADGEYIGLIG